MRYRSFTPDFKRSLIEQLLSGTANPTELCRRHNVIKEVLNKIAIIIKLRQDENYIDNRSDTAIALEQIMVCLRRSPSIISLDSKPETADVNNHFIKVICPGSKGLNIRNTNEEFYVENVFYSPHYKGLAYRGCSHNGKQGINQDVKTIIPIAYVIEIPGESCCGLYNIETGELASA